MIRPELSIRAVQLEQRLPYAALADLLAPILDEAIPHLTPIRAVAIQGALHREASGVTDGHAVALATLDVLASRLARGPFVVAIDDVQWLDSETAECLAFAIRRLTSQRLGLLLAMRASPSSRLPLGLDHYTSTTVIDLESLPLGALGAIITRHLDRELPRPTLSRIHEMSRGNPLIALELARSLPADAGPDDLPTSPDVERLIGRRVRDLTRESIELLLMAAASSRPTVDLLAAASGSGVADCAHQLGPEATDHLVEIDDGYVRFEHPLFRSAVLRSVSPGARVDAHRRLASVTEGAEQALHLAQAASGADDSVASVLEAAADDLVGRGARASAAWLLERAASLSTDLQSAADRRLAAAALYTDAGDGRRAQRLTRRAIAELPPGPTRARARASLFVTSTSDDEFAAALAEAGGDLRTRAIVQHSQAECRFLRLDLRSAIEALENAVTDAQRAGDGQTTAAAMTQLGLTQNLVNPQSGLATLRAAEAVSGSASVGYNTAATRIAMNQTAADNLDVSRERLEEIVAGCRAGGDEISAAYTEMHLVELEVRAGQLGQARRWLSAVREVLAGSGEWQVAHVDDYLESLILGREGDGETAVITATRGLTHAARTEDWAFVLLLQHTAAVGHLRCGQPAGALELLTSIRGLCTSAGIGEPGVHRYHGPEIEALVGMGRLDEAQVRIDELDDLGRRLGRPRLVGEAAHGRGLLLVAQGDNSGAIEAFNTAIATFDRAGLPWEREHTRLALGVALRRARARTEARSALDEAARTFDSMGASGWADLARSEAERISGRRSSGDELTPIETRVADLVAAGLPNKEIAAQLFLSPKTVESHLSRIYAKTGVHSRVELAALRLQS